MKRLSISILSVVLLLTFVMGSTYAADPPLVRYLVKMEGAPGPAEQAITASGGKVSHVYNIIPQWIAVEIPEAAVSGLIRNPRVEMIIVDGIFSAIEETLPWGVDRIDAEAVHPTNKGTGVPVGIIDTGIDYNHPDLDGNYVSGYDFVNEDNDPMDDHGHGTHVAGTVAAEDNGEGVIGVAPEASLYALKVLGADGSGYSSDIAAAIDWCAANGIDVVNMSIGGPDNQALHDACDAAYSAGVLLVAAAGNTGIPPGRGDNIECPARYSSVIAVAATDNSDKRARWSSTGPSLEISAPGVDITSTYLNGGYAIGSGTSMACPHVAGTAALVITAGIGDVRTQLQTTADDLGDPGIDPLYGYGLVDADEAAGAPPPPPNDPPIVSITNPADGSTFESGATILFEGTANDPEDGDLTANLVWNSNIDGEIGNGGSFSTILSDGNHTITAEVTDSGGKTGSGSISISVTSGEVDIVEITKAVYNSKKEVLTVEAISSDAPAAVLTLIGEPSLLGEPIKMRFDRKSTIYKASVRKVSSIPTSITITSSHGGSATTADIVGESALASATLQNYPNPFNPETNIEYGIKETGFVSIKIYNVIGQVVRTLVNEAQSAGFYTVVWNGRDEQGRELSSGIYYGRLVAGEQSAILKMLFLK